MTQHDKPKNKIQIKNILSGIALLGTAVSVVYAGVCWWDVSITRPAMCVIAQKTFDSLHTPIVKRDMQTMDRYYSELMRTQYMVREIVPPRLQDRAVSRWQKDSAKIFIK